MMRVLAINVYPGYCSNPFPISLSSHAESGPKQDPQASRTYRPTDALTDCPIPPRGFSCQGLTSAGRLGQRPSDEWLNRAGLRRLFGYRKADQNLRAPSSLSLHPAFRQPGFHSHSSVSNGLQAGSDANGVRRPIFGITANLKPATEQGHALSHAGESERILPGQRFGDLKPNTVIFNGQSDPSIGRTDGKVYATCAGVFRDIVAAL